MMLKYIKNASYLFYVANNASTTFNIAVKEAISMFGVPIYQFIDIEDAEQILRGIRKIGDRPIDLILHTPGGHMHASIQIARALKDHKGHTRVMTPHYCPAAR